MAIGYYVTIKRADKVRFLLGPFDTLDEAEAQVDHGSALARGYDQWCDFDAFGTCKIEANTLPSGVFDIFRKVSA